MKQGVTEGRENPLQDIDPRGWHLIQGDRPIAINFPDGYTAKAEKELENKKRDSAQTDDAVARAQTDKEKIRTGLQKVRTLFLQKREQVWIRKHAQSS